MAKLDQTTARALVDAGYMPLSDYLDMFSGSATKFDGHSETSITPEAEDRHELAVGDWYRRKSR